MRHLSELPVPGFGNLSCCAGSGCLGNEGWRHKCEMDKEHCANPNMSVVVVMLVNRGMW